MPSPSELERAAHDPLTPDVLAGGDRLAEAAAAVLADPSSDSRQERTAVVLGALHWARDRLPALLAAAREAERLRAACIGQQHEIQQTLGKALGYPSGYPEVSEVDDGSVCVGEHIAETLASEAARELTRLRARVTALETVLREVEWALSWKPNSDECPWCTRLRRDGHTKDCKLAKVLEGKP